MNRRSGTLFVITAAALWGTISIFVTLLTSLGLSSMQISAVRSLSAPLFLIPYIYIKDKRLLVIAPRDWYYFFGTGIVSLLFFNWCYFNTIKAASVSVAAVLLYTSPIFVVLMSAALFGEKLTRFKLIALALTFLGCVLVSGILSQGGSIGIYALLSGLGSGFGYALYSIFGRYALKKYSPITVTLWTIIFCGAGSLILSAAESGFALPAAFFSLKGAFGCLGMGLFCCALPYLLYTTGLCRVESSKASIYATVEPAVAAIIGVTVFKEHLTASALAGMAMIFGSVLLLAKQDK